MDFVHDALADGRPFRILTVVDQWSRQSPILEVASNMSGQSVGAALDRVLTGDAVPRSITVDHGTEFQSRALEDWSYRRGVQLDFIRPGKPVENAFPARVNAYTHVVAQGGGNRCKALYIFIQLLWRAGET